MVNRLLPLSVVLLLLVLTCPLRVKSAGAQDARLSWEDVKSLAGERTQVVKQCFLSGRVAHYQSADLRRLSYANWREQKNVEPNLADSNSVKSFFWFNDRLKWRLDIRRVYPNLGRDFEQISYDGEKYLTYAEKAAAGRVSGERLLSIHLPSWDHGDFTTFDADCLFGGGMLPCLEKTWFSGGTKPVHQGTEMIEGLSCEKFVYDGPHLEPKNKSKVAVWFSPEKRRVVKVKATVFDGQTEATPQFSAYYVVQQTTVSAGTTIPSRIRIEAYGNGGPGKVYGWLNTRLYTVDIVEINSPDSVSAFGHPVRVTARMLNEVEDSANFQTLGGEFNEELESVRSGTPPVLLEPGFTADGAAPEVAEEQAKIEMFR